MAGVVHRQYNWKANGQTTIVSDYKTSLLEKGTGSILWQQNLHHLLREPSRLSFSFLPWQIFWSLNSNERKNEDIVTLLSRSHFRHSRIFFCICSYKSRDRYAQIALVRFWSVLSDKGVWRPGEAIKWKLFSLYITYKIFFSEPHHIQVLILRSEWLLWNCGSTNVSHIMESNN